MHAVAPVAALALTLASVACTVVPHRHGGAGLGRERAAAAVMGASAADMVLPGLHLAHAVGWGSMLVVATLVLLVPSPRGPRRRTPVDAGRTAGSSRRADLARHAGSLLLMAAMWWAMAGSATPELRATTAGPVSHAAHSSAAPLAWIIVAVAAVVAAGAVGAALRRESVDRTGPFAWRHPLMAAGMLAMAVPMAIG